MQGRERQCTYLARLLEATEAASTSFTAMFREHSTSSATMLDRRGMATMSSTASRVQTGRATSRFTARNVPPSPQYTYLFRNPGKAPPALAARVLCDDLTAVPTPAGDPLRRVSRSSSPTLGPGVSEALPNILIWYTSEPGEVCPYALRSYSYRTVARC